MLELDRCFLCSYSWFLRSVSFVIFTGSYSKDKSKNVAQNEQRINVLVNPGLNVYVGFGVVKCRGKYFGKLLERNLHIVVTWFIGRVDR